MFRLKSPINCFLQLRRNRRLDFARRNQILEPSIERICFLKGQSACQCFIQDDAEGIDVAAAVGGAPKNPAWVANLRKNPLVEVQDGTAQGDYHAREASVEEYAAWWPRAVEIWPDYEGYQAKTDRQIPIFLLEPAS